MVWRMRSCLLRYGRDRPMVRRPHLRSRVGSTMKRLSRIHGRMKNFKDSSPTVDLNRTILTCEANQPARVRLLGPSIRMRRLRRMHRPHRP